MNELKLKIVEVDNIIASFDEVAKGKGNNSEWLLSEMNKEELCIEISNELIWETYTPGPVVGFWVRDPKKRYIKRPLIKDRIIHHAVIRQIQPYLEEIFSDSSFACRAGKEYITVRFNLKGEEHSQVYKPKSKWDFENDKLIRPVHTYDKRLPYYQALRTVREDFTNKHPEAEIVSISLTEGKGQLSAARHYQDLIRKALVKYNGNVVIATLDFKGYFDSIDHEVLKAIISCIFPEEPFVIWLLNSIIDAIDSGLPIGFLPSQNLANILGTVFDKYFESKGVYFTRYMDDVKILVGSHDEGLEILAKADELARKLRLTLNNKKTRIRQFKSYDTFVGFKVFPHHLEIKPSSLSRAERRVRKKKEEYMQQKISAEAFCSSVENVYAQLSASTTRLPNWLYVIIKEARRLRKIERENIRKRAEQEH